MRRDEMGRYLEEFQQGDIIHHSLSKTIFESDNNLFCLLTMNHHPLHTNTQYAADTQFGKPVVVGTLVFSLVVGLTVPDISGKAIANLCYESVDHLAPVFINDTLYARSEILAVIPSMTKKDRGIIYVETTGYIQTGKDVLRFRRKVLIPKREAI
jgi:acyl dehydratase